VLGRHVFVGSSGLASNRLGARWLAKLLAPHGIQVEYVDFSITRSLGGSFRCSTQPLLRRS